MFNGSWENRSNGFDQYQRIQRFISDTYSDTREADIWRAVTTSEHENARDIHVAQYHMVLSTTQLPLSPSTYKDPTPLPPQNLDSRRPMTSPAMTRPIEAANHKALFCTTRFYHQKRGKMISRSRGGSSLSASFCASCSASSSSARRGGVAEEDGQGTDLGLEHVVRFDMSDFHVCDRVSVGVAGRADEVIFEAVVINETSPLHNTRVVLRQLTTMQAQRRGRRAMEVLKKLARRQLMYHSYAMQVHGYVYFPSNEEPGPFTLVHGYHGSYSLRHWLQLSDWLPTLEATLALDEEWVRRVGDDNIGGPAVTRQLRLTRILMRDLLIGVNYLHSHGLAHTELTLENVHISPVDRHVKVGILGNAADFHDNKLDSTSDVNPERRKLMIAYDMRCFGFIMAKMVLQELMDPEVFLMFKYFLIKGSDPSCLREFLLPILHRNSLSGNTGLQMLDRNWGAGWNLLSLLLATSPSKRISCLDALRHPFLCGPRWRVGQSVDVIRWSLGSTAVRIAEEYIYGKQQRNRVAHFIELMEMLNPHPKQKNWLELLPGRWRLLYSTGRHIGLTLRQANPRVLIGNAYLTFTENSDSDGPSFHLTSDISFKVISTPEWPHDKSGAPGSLHINAKSVRLTPGSTLFYIKEESNGSSNRLSRESIARKLRSKKWKSMGFIKELPSSLPASKLTTDDIEISMNLESSSSETSLVQDVLREVRTQIPPEMFDISKLVCGTYIDSRLLILRGVNGSALLLTRSS